MIKNAQLGWNDSGTPVSNQFDDIYFSNINGLEESRYVFIKQNQLPMRWQQTESQNQASSSRFVIAETGFGTGLNFLAVWHEFVQFRQANPESNLTQLHFISFEKFPVHINDLIKAHAAWPVLADYAQQLQTHYPIAVPECHRIVLADGMITLDLWFGDIHDSMPKLAQTDQGLVDAWFLDGFAPSKNKDMWNNALYQHMARLTKTYGTCATFTAAGFVRRGLIEAGFDMKKVKGFGTKREMIAGVLANKKAKNNYAPWLQRYPMQPVDSDSSIAIIGGGIASATLALALYRRGYKLELYCEDDKPALGASGNRQGALYPLIAEPNSSLNRFFSPAFLFARQLVKQASQHLEFDHDFCGVTQFAWSDKAKSKLKKMLLNDYPADLLHWLNAEQTTEAIGLDSDLESIHYPFGGWLCPQQLTQALIYELKKQPNVTVHFETQIDSLTYDRYNTKWALTSKQHVFEHSAVVVANGYQFSKFKQLNAIAATPVKGQVSHIPTTDNLRQLKTVLCYDGYMTPQNPNNRHHCIGASYDRTHIDNQFDTLAQVSNGERLKQCVPNQTWPDDVDTSGNLSRQGVRSVTRDHLPFVGNVFQFDPVVTAYAKLDPQILRKHPELMPPIPYYPNLFCMVGLGARGLCSAPLLAEVLASQIAGDPQPLPLEVLEKLHPARMWVRKMLKGRPITEKNNQKM